MREILRGSRRGEVATVVVKCDGDSQKDETGLRDESHTIATRRVAFLVGAQPISAM